MSKADYGKEARGVANSISSEALWMIQEALEEAYQDGWEDGRTAECDRWLDYYNDPEDDEDV